jgi:hypothetical protein
MKETITIILDNDNWLVKKIIKKKHLLYEYYNKYSHESGVSEDFPNFTNKKTAKPIDISILKIGKYYIKEKMSKGESTKYKLFGTYYQRNYEKYPDYFYHVIYIIGETNLAIKVKFKEDSEDFYWISKNWLQKINQWPNHFNLIDWAKKEFNRRFDLPKYHWPDRR